MKEKAKHRFSAPITETKQYKSISMVGNEETKTENYHHNKKKHERSQGVYVMIK